MDIYQDFFVKLLFIVNYGTIVLVWPVIQNEFDTPALLDWTLGSKVFEIISFFFIINYHLCHLNKKSRFKKRTTKI